MYTGKFTVKFSIQNVYVFCMCMYLHRAGRCGRAGRQGLVVNFATPSTKFVIRRFGKQLGAKMMDCEVRSGQVFLKPP